MKKILIFGACLLTVVLVAQQAVQNGNTLAGLYYQVPTIGGVKDPATLSGSALLWQYPWQKATNAVRLGQATVTLDATLDCVVINTNASFQIGGIANMPVAGTSVKDLLVLVTNNSAANINVTFTAAWHIDKAQGLNQSGTWTITNTCYFIGHWNANNGLYSNFNFNAAQ